MSDSSSSCTVTAMLRTMHGAINRDSLLRIIRGAPDLDTLRAVSDNEDLASGIAMMNHIHPTVRVVAALTYGLITIIGDDEQRDHDVHAALRMLISAGEGSDALDSWVEIAPAGWGEPSADALIDAATNGRYLPGTAAALIGACDESAMLVDAPNDIAYAIRCWGRGSSGNPAAWVQRISRENRRRIMQTLHRHPHALAACLPWLPAEDVASVAIRANNELTNALDAFADASPAARTCHAPLMQHVMRHARPAHVGLLVRVACAMDATEDSESIWQRIAALLQEQPDAAALVVAAAPWDRLHQTVRETILFGADQSDICAAIAVARGKRTAARITAASAAAFFGALSPGIWKNLPDKAQRPWLAALNGNRAQLAVRSIGLTIDVLARAFVDNDLVAAARCWVNDHRALRDALLPVALAHAQPSVAHALIADMPELPGDPGAFFVIAGQHADPGIIDRARATLRTPGDLADAIVLQRTQNGIGDLYDTCVTLATVLRGRSWTSLKPVATLLDASARAVVNPDCDACAAKLAPPYRRVAMRQTLDAIAALPPDVAIPAFRALWSLGHTWEAPDALMEALRAHGPLAIAVIDALRTDARKAVFPAPPQRKLANALRNVMNDDPVVASYLAHVLAARQWACVAHALLAMPSGSADAIASALPDGVRAALLDDAAQRLPPPVVAAVAAHDVIVALALAALASDDDTMRLCGRAALTARSMHTRAFWAELPASIQETLRTHDVIGDAIGDLLADAPSPSVQRKRRTQGKRR